MSRLDPSKLDQRTREVLRKRPWEAVKAAPIRAPRKASPAERDRVWNILLSSALHGERDVVMEKLNARELEFLQRLGFSYKHETSDEESSFSQVHLGRLTEELKRSIERVRELELDEFGSNELRIAEELENYRRLRIEIRDLREMETEASRSVSYFTINLDRRSLSVEIIDEYDSRWIDWLLRDGQKFFVIIEKYLHSAANRGDAWEIFKVTNYIGETQRHLEFSPHRPWTPHKYFVEEEHLTSHGPHPLVFRYFMETLGYKCTLKWEDNYAKVRLGW